MTEKRRFSRIIYQAPAQLEQRDLRLNATIQDLSLHGLLLQAEGLDTLNPALLVDVGFSFHQSEQEITLAAQIVDVAQDQIRLKITNIGIESISQLKRFIELNVGNNELLNRELDHLSDLGEK
ncbi:PilZ domain-containing protein [Vibrio parahaemolyticus]|uniref:Cyclic diguanosine monophosphate-binding protein n=1 Tax=Vibrio parahaemolyticus TaxID=670 RepID=A0AA46UHS7_VIBPH|nr:PilZ domain-containing protein [Vibrio parahaemolyticus]EGQ9807819.1 PilZ domain-containing protein [Vibrio parahaemolyticus]EHR0917851.1 PilZ domain-containing protein [Vibrio parahaemolyticus]EIU7856594.1 PilZ domain-containing protein [Vibrio parahaemolyticus]EJG0012466.1 PilZ domain-containing protein [Vibrio parahaemolyticus]EJM7850980.1 PilZ domain-containing protein [Vibrio parahaemolyticus]